MNRSRSGSLALGLRRVAQYRIVVTVLQILHEAWPEAIADAIVTASSHEDAISDVLRWKMVDVKNRMNPAPGFRFLREPQSDDPSRATPTGLIDIMVAYTYDERVYLTMECKRISSLENSLALAYVRQGINRFVSCKYSPGHPYGIMVGYAVCKNLEGCAKRVAETLLREPTQVTGFDAKFHWQTDDTVIPGETHYRSRHNQVAPGNQIEVIHAFVALL